MNPNMVDALCPSFAWVPVDARTVFVFACEDEPALSTLSFACPSCKQPRTLLAPASVLSILRAAGAEVRTWRKVPLPLPPLTCDDLLDFHDSIDAELASLLGAA